MGDCGTCTLCEDGLETVTVLKGGKRYVGDVVCDPEQGIRRLYIRRQGCFAFKGLAELVKVLESKGFVVESASGSVWIMV